MGRRVTDASQGPGDAGPHAAQRPMLMWLRGQPPRWARWPGHPGGPRFSMWVLETGALSRLRPETREEAGQGQTSPRAGDGGRARAKASEAGAALSRQPWEVGDPGSPQGAAFCQPSEQGTEPGRRLDPNPLWTSGLPELTDNELLSPSPEVF